MRKNEIKVGGHYLANVSGQLVTVRVDKIRDNPGGFGSTVGRGSLYDVTNLTTGRKTTFRSAAKFRQPINIKDVEKYGIAGAMARESQRQRRQKVDDDLERAAKVTVAHDQRQHSITVTEEHIAKYAANQDVDGVEDEHSADPISMPSLTSAGSAGTSTEGKKDGPFARRSSTRIKKRGGASLPAVTSAPTPATTTAPTAAASAGVKRVMSADGSAPTNRHEAERLANGSHPVSSLLAIESAELGQRFLQCDYPDDRPLTPEQSRTVLPGTPSPNLEAEAIKYVNKLEKSNLAKDPHYYDRTATGVVDNTARQTGLAAKIAEHVAQYGKVPTDTAPHIVVRAYAGTGKTFTQIVGVAWAFGGDKIWPEVQRTMAERINAKAGQQKVDPDTFRVIPSDEQQAVWNSFALSQGKVKTVTYCAFNKSIVTEFSEEWGWLVKLMATQGITLQFATVNSLGNSVVSRAFGRLDVKDWHTSTLLSKHLGKNPHDLKRQDPVLVSAVSELVGLCKLNLTGWTETGGFDVDAVTPDELDELIHHYDIELNGQRNRVYDLVPTMLKASLDPVPTREIDYNDQNWLPMVLNLPIPQVDFLLIDEGQDLPRCKQEFGRRLGRRIALVGDVHQAIYGFAGADVDSIPRMERLLGVEQPLTLTETRRCGKAIVEEARKIVPGFKAHESNGAGSVRTLARDKYSAEAEDRDMVLCRVNAPLISEALRFIKAGRKAVVRGREFGKSIIEFVTKLKAGSVPDLVAKVDAWYKLECDKENAKRNPSEQRLINFADRRDCVLAFTDGSTTVQEVLDKLDLVFAGKQCPRCRKHFNESLTDCFNCRYPLIKPDGVLFSSVHRAKGLEAKRVFILSFKGAEMPHPMARSEWQQEQEQNCLYIARTRAVEELIYVR